MGGGGGRGVKGNKAFVYCMIENNTSKTCLEGLVNTHTSFVCTIFLLKSVKGFVMQCATMVTACTCADWRWKLGLVRPAGENGFVDTTN